MNHRKCGRRIEKVTLRETTTTVEEYAADEEEEGAFVEVKGMEPEQRSTSAVCGSCNEELEQDEVEAVTSNLRART